MNNNKNNINSQNFFYLTKRRYKGELNLMFYSNSLNKNRNSVNGK